MQPELTCRLCKIFHNIGLLGIKSDTEIDDVFFQSASRFCGSSSFPTSPLFPLRLILLVSLLLPLRLPPFKKQTVLHLFDDDSVFISRLQIVQRCKQRNQS